MSTNTTSTTDQVTYEPGDVANGYRLSADGTTWKPVDQVQPATQPENKKRGWLKWAAIGAGGLLALSVAMNGLNGDSPSQDVVAEPEPAAEAPATHVPDDLPTDVIDEEDYAVEDEFMTTAITVQALMTAANECAAALEQASSVPGYETDDQVFLDGVESTYQACSAAWSNVPATGDGHLDASIDIYVEDMDYAAFSASIADPANPGDMNITRDAMIAAADTQDLVMDLIANWSEDTSADLGL